MISSYRPYFGWPELLAVLRPGAGRSQFEAAMANCIGAHYGLAFAYGRSATVALFKAMGVSQAEVLLPGLSLAPTVAGSTYTYYSVRGRVTG